MELIVAVYDDWGIGKDGTQPVTIKDDREFFAMATMGTTIVAGRKTIEDFPGKRPLRGRLNVVLTHSAEPINDFIVCNDIEQLKTVHQVGGRMVVIGGGSIYEQLLPQCDTAYVTKVHCTPESDTFFRNLDEDPEWHLASVVRSGEENGICYEMCIYRRLKVLYV